MKIKYDGTNANEVVKFVNDHSKDYHAVRHGGGISLNFHGKWQGDCHEGQSIIRDGDYFFIGKEEIE
jgi:hypothetical protein